MEELGQYYGCGDLQLSGFACPDGHEMGLTSYLVPGENDILQNKHTNQTNNQF